jgi:DNA-directed RNA polymerase beta' subunit
MSARLLTTADIEYITDFIVPAKHIPKATADSIARKNKAKIVEMIKDIKLVPEAIDEFKEEVRRQYFASKIQPGESVGILTAQSIGERQTQSTLNSVVYDTELLLYVDGVLKRTTIGEFTEESIKSAKEVQMHPNDTTYAELDNDVRVVSVDENGKVAWKRVEAVTRHPVINEDGTDTVVEVKTASGRTVTATKGLSFLKVQDDGTITPVKGNKLCIGDMLPVSMYMGSIMKESSHIRSKEEYMKGFFLGVYIAKGSIDIHAEDCIILKNIKTPLADRIERWCGRHREAYVAKTSPTLNDVTVYDRDLSMYVKRMSMYNRLSSCVFGSSTEYMQGLMEGYLAGGSFVIGDMIKVTSGSMYLLEDMRQIFAILNVPSSIVKRDGVWELVMSQEDVDKFETRKSGDIVKDPIVSIVEVDNPRPYVYDLTVEDTKNFCIYNGLHMRDTFHSTGLTVKTVVTGVPRFTELLNATKEPKARTCTIYYKGENKDISTLRKKVGNGLRKLSLSKLKKKVSFSADKRTDWWYEDFDMFYGTGYQDYTYSIRWDMDMDKMFEYQVKLKDIAKIIEDHFDDIKCVFSPEQEGVLDVYIDTSHVTHLDTVFISTEEAIESYIEDTVIEEVESHKLYGIDGIEDIFFEKKGDEWVVETEGSNLSKVFALSNIDFARTVCDNMWEIYETLGIEAARNFLLEEFDKVVSSDGNFVHQSHTMLLVDIMTFQGTLISINRYGLKKEQCGPLSKASFEESLDNFLKAGAFGEKENTKSVSASIMLGKTGRFGTGICDLIVNIGQLPGMPKTIREDVVEKQPRKVF